MTNSAVPVHFRLAWFISVAVFLAIYILVGLRTRGSIGGLLIDSRGRYSLNHLQLSVWWILVPSTLIATFLSYGKDPAALVIPNTLLILMGLSGGTAVASGSVKSAKDASQTADVASEGKTLTLADGKKIEVEPKLTQVVLEEEGKRADQAVSITKFQNVVLTLLGAFVFITLTLKTQGYPAFPDEFVWLLGIGHAGYVAGKVPNVA